MAVDRCVRVCVVMPLLPCCIILHGNFKNVTLLLSDAAGAATRESERPAAGDASVARAVPPGTRSRPLARTIPEALR